MRVLHTSDWHLGQILYGQSRTPEHHIVLKQIIEICAQECVDLLMICGDVFDTYNPSAESEETWFWFLKTLHSTLPSIHIYVISGNHDSALRLRAPGPVLKDLNVHIYSQNHFLESGKLDPNQHLVIFEKCRRSDEERVHKICLGLVPFVKPSEYPPWVNSEQGAHLHEFLKTIYEDLALKAQDHNCPILLTGHLFASGGSVSENSERKIQRGNLEAFSLKECIFPLCHIALGHLHKPQKVHMETASACYSGSLFPLSFVETQYVHGVTLAQWHDNDSLPEIKRIPLVRPRRILQLGSADTSPETLLEEVQQLSFENDVNSLEAFAEVRIDAPPGQGLELRDKISKALIQRNILLLQFHVQTKSNKNKDQKSSANDFQDFAELDPLWVFRQTFEEMWNKPSDLEIEKLFLEIVGETQHLDKVTH
jgi:DNA repair protein SbcD/Mre11